MNTRPFWVTVEDSHSGEIMLQRQMTKQEWAEDAKPLQYAQEAFDGLEIDSEEAMDFPHLAPIVVTFYRRKSDIGSAVCFSMHGFYLD